MRYSLYLYINQMSHSLLEATAYIQSTPDAPDVPGLITICGDLLQTLEKFLRNNIASITDASLMNVLQKVQHLLNQPSQRHELHTISKQLCTLVQTGIAYRFRVLFLAELGEKWDALESVYRAFCARPDCDPVVVALPVHRTVVKNGKQEIEILYEDYLTALGVPFLNCKNYDVSKDCPDLTFHTNPYESTIPVEYWPRNLVKHTRLVYVPYYTDFTVDETVIQSNCKQEMAECAWRIVALSEKMRDLHRKYALRKGENLMITGLPKWDHILHLKENTVPVDWKNKIANKTVFLWNSHYNVGDNSTIFQNAQPILDLFANRQDIALIWRPHPMTDTVFRLYNTKHYDWWKQLTQTVADSDNMVMDLNHLCDAGFQYSHALISDRSSMMVQYMLTGKPVLWLKNAYKSTDKAVIDVSCFEYAKQPAEISAFIDRIVAGLDPALERRRKVICKDMALADGACGQRVCEQTIAEILKEDFTTITDKM